MRKHDYYDVLNSIDKEEQRLSLEYDLIDGADQMIKFLKSKMDHLKARVLEEGFSDIDEEILFFKEVKPNILSKLIYYNKIYNIESGCPVSEGKFYSKYFSNELQILKKEYKEYICDSGFLKYYRSKRTDRDIEYFSRGKIVLHNGLSSYVFEIDTEFSTYYDYKVAKILANEKLYDYLLSKIENFEAHDSFNPNQDYTQDFFWTDSKNAMIELIYSLYITGCISHGKVGIRKMAMVFQVLFRIDLGDLHHAFHRMKFRTGSQTSFLDHLKSSLEEYMNKDL